MRLANPALRPQLNSPGLYPAKRLLFCGSQPTPNSQPGVDTGTTDFYSAQAVPYSQFSRQNGGVATPYIPKAFPQPAYKRILDIGSGSGRDLADMLQQGYDAYGIEPVQSLIDKAYQDYPNVIQSGRLQQGAFNTAPTIFDKPFDAVLCNAVLMHVSPVHFQSAIQSISAVLRPHGRLLLTYNNRPVNAENRNEQGRLFVPRTADEIIQSFNQAGFKLVNHALEQDRHQRQFDWDILTFEKN